MPTLTPKPQTPAAAPSPKFTTTTPPTVGTPDHVVAVNKMIGAPDPSTLDLTPAERSRLAELGESTRCRVLELLATGAPVLVKEARRLLLPPAPHEPSPDAMPLTELLLGLPGRPDRVASAAGRLALELGDHRSYQFYQSAASAVCRREVPGDALVMAAREGLSPKAKRPGAVFATAWKRESRAV